MRLLAPPFRLGLPRRSLWVALPASLIASGFLLGLAQFLFAVAVFFRPASVSPAASLVVDLMCAAHLLFYGSYALVSLLRLRAADRRRRDEALVSEVMES